MIAEIACLQVRRQEMQRRLAPGAFFTGVVSVRERAPKGPWYGQAIFRIQPNRSSILPYWMPISVS